MTTSTEKEHRARPGAFIPTLIVLGLLVFALIGFAGFWTELKWYEQIEAARVFWTQYGASIALGAIGFVLVFGVVVLNLWIAVRERKTPENVINLDGNNFRDTLLGRKWLTFGVVPAVVSLLFGAGLAGNWQTFLLWINRSSFG